VLGSSHRVRFVINPVLPAYTTYSFRIGLIVPKLYLFCTYCQIRSNYTYFRPILYLFTIQSSPTNAFLVTPKPSKFSSKGGSKNRLLQLLQIRQLLRINPLQLLRLRRQQIEFYRYHFQKCTLSFIRFQFRKTIRHILAPSIYHPQEIYVARLLLYRTKHS